MANTTRLVITCETAAGDKNFSYNYINAEIATPIVKQIGNAIVTNGSIFKNIPLTFKAAKTVTTTEVDFDISD